jgi:hypothetical protein
VGELIFQAKARLAQSAISGSTSTGHVWLHSGDDVEEMFRWLSDSLNATPSAELTPQERYAKFGTLLPLGERPKETDAEIIAAASSARAPKGWREVLADVRLGLAAGSRSKSNSDFEIEYGGALLDAVDERLEELESHAEHRAELFRDLLNRASAWLPEDHSFQDVIAAAMKGEPVSATREHEDG